MQTKGKRGYSVHDLAEYLRVQLVKNYNKGGEYGIASMSKSMIGILLFSLNF